MTAYAKAQRLFRTVKSSDPVFTETLTLDLGDVVPSMAGPKRPEGRVALPAVRSAVVRSASVVRERRATFSLAPGQPPRPPARTPVAGFYLAGDWTDTGLPGTIESAAVSGHRAAAAL